jgi:uncharacterized protein
MPKRFFSWLIWITVGLIFVTYGGLFLFQDQLVFQSIRLERSYTFNFDYPFEEHFIEVKATEDLEAVELSALFFKTDSASKGLVLYFHGNRGNLQRWGNYAPDLTKNGFDVLMIDYRGYGKSTGSPSEEALYHDAEVVMAWAKSRGLSGKLIIYGRSLGSAVASHLAMEVQPDLLILETPFDELLGVINPDWKPLASLLPLRSVFPNNVHLKAVKSRKVIFHGTDDRIVPLSSALELRPLLDAESDFIIIPGGGHRNLRSYPQYQSGIASLLGAL